MTALWSPDDQPDEITPEEVAELAKMGPPPQPARVWVKASWVGEIQSRLHDLETAIGDLRDYADGLGEPFRSSINQIFDERGV